MPKAANTLITSRVRDVTDPDAELIALGVKFDTYDATMLELDAVDASDEVHRATHRIWWAAVHLAVELPARTDLGRAVKARMITALVRDCGSGDGPIEQMVLSLARDVLAGEG